MPDEHRSAFFTDWNRKRSRHQFQALASVAKMRAETRKRSGFEWTSVVSPWNDFYASTAAIIVTRERTTGNCIVNLNGTTSKMFQTTATLFPRMIPYLVGEPGSRSEIVSLHLSPRFLPRLNSCRKSKSVNCKCKRERNNEKRGKSMTYFCHRQQRIRIWRALSC